MALFGLRSVVLAAALIAHARSRTKASALTAGLHLAALESCITELMATGSWASGWANVDVLRPANPAVIALAAIAISTAIAYACVRRGIASHTGRLWLLVVAAVLCGTSLGRALTPIVMWAVAGAIVATIALVWVADLHQAIARNDRLTSDTIWLADWRWPLAAWSVLASLLISRMVFEGVPHVPDEVGYWFQAKYFATGALWLPSPPAAGAFELQHVMNLDGKWFSIFPPGWPAVLALGFAAGVPTVVNPLIAGATILVLYPFLRRLYGARTANAAGALLALSPMFLFMSGGVMAHPLSALCTVGAAAALHRAWDAPSPWLALFAGALLGWLALTRPFEGMLVCAAFGLYALTRWTHIRARRAVLVSLLLPIGAVAIGALILPYFAALTGRAFDDPVTKYFDTVYYPRSNRLGFGPDIANFGWGTDFLPGHSPLEGALNAQLSAQLIHFELFGWPIGSWAPIVLYLLWRRDVWAREDALFLTIIIVVMLGQACYWYAGADYGARYWYQLLIPCCVLAAKALTRALPDRTVESPAAQTPALTPALTLAPAALVLSLIAVVIFVPWRGATKYVGYRGMSGSVARLVRECPMTHGLVFVHNAAANTPFGVYSAAAILNDPGFRGDAPIFARETSAEVTQAARAAFPARPVWLIDVPRDPRDTARVLDMPASAPDACRAAADRGTK